MLLCFYVSGDWREVVKEDAKGVNAGNDEYI